MVRFDLDIENGKPPAVKSRTVIGSGFGAKADKDVFLVGPTGLQLGADDALYVSDAIGNSINVIHDASTRTTSAGTGDVVTKDGLLQRPLAMTTAPNGNLIVTNARNGQVVEIDPKTGKQLTAIWVDQNKAQTPPGSGDLFGNRDYGIRRWLLFRKGRDEHAGHRQMSDVGEPPKPSRRRFLAGAAGVAVASANVATAAGAAAPQDGAPPPRSRSGACIKPASRRRRKPTPISPPSIYRPKARRTSSL